MKLFLLWLVATLCLLIFTHDASAQRPVVTISATISQASELGINGNFRVTRTGSTLSALVVEYSLSGTATNGTDYQSLPGNVSIPANSFFVDFPVRPVSGDGFEGNETVIVTLSDRSTYDLGAPSAATVTIADNQDTVTIKATDSSAAEANDDGEFIITRDGPLSPGLTIDYGMTGAATNGTDYITLPGSVDIPAGAATVSVPVRPINDTQPEPFEDVVLKLKSSPRYILGSARGASISILDNDTVVKISSSTTPSIDEVSLGKSTIVFNRAGDTTQPFQILYSLGGTATHGVDYLDPKAVAFPVGATSATLDISPITDQTDEPNETVIVTILNDKRYTVGSPKAATITIIEQAVPTLTISATDATASEAGQNTGVFTITRTPNSNLALTVFYEINPSANLTLGKPATNGADFDLLSGTLTIPPGSQTATLIIKPVDDAEVEGPEHATLQLSPKVFYKLGSFRNADVTIEDND